MKFFIDTAQIKNAASMGVLDGVTTNPSLMAKVGIKGRDNILKHYKAICDLVPDNVSDEGIRTNCTLVFTVSQALLAAKAGASFVSPFVGRLDDISTDGLQLIRDIAQVFKNYDFKTEILVASVRHPMHLVESAKIGAHVATMPFAVIEQLAKHPLTDTGLAKFLSDHEASQK